MCYEPNSLAMSNIDALHSVGEVDSSSKSEIQILVGANLKRLRKQRGLSRRQLARLAQVERSTLRQLERGETMPSVGMLWKLARDPRCLAPLSSNANPIGQASTILEAELFGLPGAAAGSAWRRDRPDLKANATHRIFMLL